MPITQPQTYDVLPQVSGLLQAENVLGSDNFTPYGGIIVASGEQLDLTEGDPLENPDPAPDGFWWRIVLMPEIAGIAPPPQYDDSIRSFSFRIRIDTVPTKGMLSFGIVKFSEDRHQRCYNILQNKRIAITDASPVIGFKRETYPTPMFRDETGAFRYQTAPYFAVIEP